MRDVTGLVGETSSLTLPLGGLMAAKGDLVHFGEKTTESIALKVKGVEAGENFSGILHMVPAAPEIDTLADAEVPPAWSGRVGSEILPGLVLPAQPRFTSISTGIEGTGDVDNVLALLTVGTGSGALDEQFRIEHRLLGAAIWSQNTVPVAVKERAGASKNEAKLGGKILGADFQEKAGVVFKDRGDLTETKPVAKPKSVRK